MGRNKRDTGLFIHITDQEKGEAISLQLHQVEKYISILTSYDPLLVKKRYMMGTVLNDLEILNVKEGCVNEEIIPKKNKN